MKALHLIMVADSLKVHTPSQQGLPALFFNEVSAPYIIMGLSDIKPYATINLLYLANEILAQRVVANCNIKQQMIRE
jgi:hypothetical protein